MNEQPRGMRTLLIGLDGACHPILAPLIEAGVTPNLGRVFDGGASGPLESQIPPATPGTWPSLYTGMNPGKHGVFGLLDFDGYDWDVVDASRLRERPIWERLDHYGLSSVVINAPVTHLPRPFEGALIPGYVAPEDPTCHPEGLLDDVRDAIGDYRVYPAGEDVPPVDEYRELVRMRGRAFRYLVDRLAPDFGFVAFRVTDAVFHDHPGDTEAVRATYAAVDDQIGAILDAYEPDNVIVASDHGIGTNGGYTFRVNEFLRAEGFVESRRRGTDTPRWETIRGARFREGAGDTPPKREVLSRLSALLSRIGAAGRRIAAITGAVGLDGVVRRWAPDSVTGTGTERVDFAASRAYMRSHTECGVRINLEGREPDGVVPREDYDEVREELVALLSSARTPDGDPVFEDVAPREEYFDGPATTEAVDVVTVPAGFDHVPSTGLSDGAFDEPADPWSHEREGVIAAAGDAIRSGRPIEGAHLFDVAPTVLATLDVPADERMDGSTLPIVESSGERPYLGVGRRRKQATNDPEIERRLSNLGDVDRNP